MEFFFHLFLDSCFFFFFVVGSNSRHFVVSKLSIWKFMMVHVLEASNVATPALCAEILTSGRRSQQNNNHNLHGRNPTIS